MQEQRPTQSPPTSAPFWIVLTAVVLALLLWEGFKKAFVALLIPFGIAFAAAKLTRPMGLRLSKLARVNPKGGCVVWGLLLCLGAAVAATSLSGTLWDRITTLSHQIPTYANAVEAHVATLSHKVSTVLPFLAEEGGKFGDLIGGVVEEAASSLGGAAAGALGNAVSAFPQSILSLFIGVVAFLYLIADMDGIGQSATRLLTCFLPQNTVCAVSHGFTRFTDAMLGYLRSTLILMLATFGQLAAVFLFLGLENPLLTALFVAFIDALPLLGCGIVLIPWALWCFLEGNALRGVVLLILQGLVYGVRQFLEPHLIGKMSGIHPFLALAVLFAGLKLGGVTGMILAPILLIAVVGSREKE